VTDCAPGKLVDKLRLKEAKRLLRETKFTVSDICYQAGYGGLSSFYRRFTQAYGLNPAEYCNKPSA